MTALIGKVFSYTGLGMWRGLIKKELDVILEGNNSLKFLKHYWCLRIYSKISIILKYYFKPIILYTIT